tara:strand:- start:282 stop:551 length:270 start_codon:yes stop_codon:yes gene_type:complete
LDLYSSIIIRLCIQLRARAQACEESVSDVTGGDRHLASATLSAIDDLEAHPNLLQLVSTWQMVRGLEGWAHHQSKIQALTGEKKTSKFL